MCVGQGRGNRKSAFTLAYIAVHFVRPRTGMAQAQTSRVSHTPAETIRPLRLSGRDPTGGRELQSLGHTSPQDYVDWVASGEMTLDGMLYRDNLHMPDRGYCCLGEAVSAFILHQAADATN
jgi:hypothetical protein